MLNRKFNIKGIFQSKKKEKWMKDKIPFFERFYFLSNLYINMGLKLTILRSRVMCYTE